jgi:restriction system protein
VSQRDPIMFWDNNARGTSFAAPIIVEKAALLAREFDVRDPQLLREALRLLIRPTQLPDKAEGPASPLDSSGEKPERIITPAFQRTIARPEFDRNAPPVVVSSVIIPAGGEYTDPLVEVTSPAWDAIWSIIKDNQSKIYELPPERLEELVAASYAKDGFRVQLTPRSNDHGRDIIAIRDGIHGYKLIGSVKRYAEGRLVRYDDVRALLGVMSGERDTSKGVLVTTSDFPPNIGKDPFIGPFLPTRLQLMNGDHLRQWLEQLAKPKLFLR